MYPLPFLFLIMSKEGVACYYSCCTSYKTTAKQYLLSLVGYPQPYLPKKIFVAQGPPNWLWAPSKDFSDAFTYAFAEVVALRYSPRTSLNSSLLSHRSPLRRLLAWSGVGVGWLSRHCCPFRLLANKGRFGVGNDHNFLFNGVAVNGIPASQLVTIWSNFLY